MFRTLRSLIVLCICACIYTCETKVADDPGSTELDIIPYPNKVLKRGGHLTLSNNFWIIANVSDSTATELARYLARNLKILTAKDALIADLFSNRKHKQSIQITLDNNLKSESKEAYILDISSSQIKIKAKSAGGIFYGIQTLLQLLEDGAVNDTYVIPKLVIMDAPRFAIRGIMIKPSQLNKQIEKSLFKTMASLKLNTIFLLDEASQKKVMQEDSTKNNIHYFSGQELAENLKLFSKHISNLEPEEISSLSTSNTGTLGLVLDLTAAIDTALLVNLPKLAKISWTTSNENIITERIK